jgi:hypothetical protein
MLLASYALACAADSRPVACHLVFHSVCRQAFRRQVFPQTGHRAYRLVFRQTYPLVFHPACHSVCHSAELRRNPSAATVSPRQARRQRAEVLSGSHHREETKGEADECRDSWNAKHRPDRRVVPPAVLASIRVRNQGRLAVVLFPVWIPVHYALVPIALVPLLVPFLVWILVQISRAPILLAWDEKKQAGARKAAPSKEQYPQDGWRRPVSAGRRPGRWVDRSTDR